MNTIKKLVLGVALFSMLSFGLLVHADTLDFGTVTLRQGSSGPYVTNLQNALNSFNGASLNVDGYFGAKTKYAVQAFQTTQGLSPDGVVGSATKRALLKIPGGNPVGTAPVLQSLSVTAGGVGTTVIISGSGFVPDTILVGSEQLGNTVLFSGSPVNASYVNPNEVSFVVPNSVGPDCQANVVCPMFERLVTSGTYTVAVRTKVGTSNALQFNVSNTLPVSSACTPVPITSFSDGINRTSMGIPVLEVTTPIAGATYHVGDTLQIAWNDCESYQGNVNISLVGQGQTIPIASNIPASALSYQYTIPATYNPPYDLSAQSVTIGGNYTVSVMTNMVSDSSADGSSSGSFSIEPLSYIQ